MDGSLLTPEMLKTASHVDTEGWGSLNLKEVGVHKWVEQDYVGMWCFAWRLPGMPVPVLWFPGDPDPEPLLDHLRRGGIFTAHNAPFDRHFWNRVVRRYCPHWPEISIEQCDCTVARVAAIGVPGQIEYAAEVLGIEDFEKENEGSKLVKKYATASYDKRGNRIWPTPDEITTIGTYNVKDVVLEEGIADRAMALSPRERRVWILDQHINDRGFAIDLPLVRKLAAIVDLARERITARLKELTGGVVTSYGQHERIAKWIESRGIPCKSTAKAKLPEIIEACKVIDAEHYADVLEVLDLKRQGGKSSVDKLYKMLECVCADGRLRGQLQYHGASTGRWAGRLTQPHNFYRVDPEKDGDDIEKVLAIVMACDDPAQALSEIEYLFRDHEAKARAEMRENAPRKSVMDMAAKCIRSTIIAAPGMKLIGGDKSNIEGRINAWIHNEEWKVEAYKKQDRKEIKDTYVTSYAASFGVDPKDVTPAQRQIGKVQELALGYQGSIGAYINMGAGYGVKPEAIAKVVMAAKYNSEEWKLAEEQYRYTVKMRRETFGLQPLEWISLKVVVNAWRAAHPNITQGWWDLQDAALNAVQYPGEVHRCCSNRVAYMVDRGILWCMLPSQRLLAYCNPRIINTRGGRIIDVDDEDCIVEIDDGDEDIYREKTRLQVAYDGFASQSKKWGFKTLYGGKQDENVVSGLARDCLVEDMFRAESCGYRTILTVHDEILCENYPSVGSKDELRAMMNQGYAFAPGLPLEAKTWEGDRYEK